ncbi:type 2 isopentenyl-diphosphate Delta-isomerase [Planococcus sp. SSTMD024]|uniref:type 2 isopentenyl-diphosphate Delta-isomerase n=1 Tax=Planococcus sp. SSTMD024 TaxID=3242163 RepID=UPI00351E5DC3
MSRAKRKMDHINYALSTGQCRATWLDCVRFVHQALPGIGVADVSLEPKTGDLNLKSPVFINAMTGGGGSETLQLNAMLARAAKETGIAMAVGSQMAALKDKNERESYQIVRKENPDGTIFGNLGSEATVEQALEAVEMIEADALQIHLNVVQELTMPEGDRQFRGALERIGMIAEALDVPVIVKETGFGISLETAGALNKTQVAAIDASGFGGTNFASIENERRKRKLAYFEDWGIPTAAAIVECRQGFNRTVLASGGLQDAGDVVRAFRLGAGAAGIAGSFLKHAVSLGEAGLIEEINGLHEDLRMLMTALGARTIEDIRSAPAVIDGELLSYLQQRGFETEHFAVPLKN